MCKRFLIEYLGGPIMPVPQPIIDALNKVQEDKDKLTCLHKDAIAAKTKLTADLAALTKLLDDIYGKEVAGITLVADPPTTRLKE